MKLELSSDAVERILRAAGLDNFRLDVIEDALVPANDEGGPPIPLFVIGDALRENILFYYGAAQRGRDKKNREDIRRLRVISKAARRLIDLVQPDKDLEWTLSQELQFIIGQVDDLHSSVESEIDRLDSKIKWGDDGETIGFGESRRLAETLRTRSPFEWLVGQYLPETFEKYFGEKPGLSRRPSDGKLLDGKYLRFAEQVLIEFGITKKNGRTYERESIAKAFSDVRGGRIRRRPRR
jgi:hypothetical protein